jgi:hypothetical protein
MKVTLEPLPALGEATKYYDLWEVRHAQQAAALRVAAAPLPVALTASSASADVDADVDMHSEVPEESASVVPKKRVMMEVCISVVRALSFVLTGFAADRSQSLAKCLRLQLLRT